MKIAVVTRMLRKDKLEGFGVFAHELLSRITKQQNLHQFHFLFDRTYDRSFIYGSNVNGHILFPPAIRPALLTFWYQHRLNWFLNHHKPDVLVSPDGGIPVSARIPTLSVIHDLNFEHFPQDLPPAVRKYYRKYRSIAAHATRIVTVSEFSKQDIVSTYNVPESKIDVVYNGAGSRFSPLTAERIMDCRRKYSASQPFLLFVGSIHQRKNLARMMQAFTLFRERHSPPVKFLIAGAKRWWDDEMEKAYSDSVYKDDILFIGRVNDPELPLLTASALALLFVTRFEGFGIPVIEAMKSGVPVITSNVSSLPEVAGDAALLAEPDSAESICHAMVRIATEETLRKILSAKGIERAGLFSWDDSARKFWNSIEKTVS